MRHRTPKKRGVPAPVCPAAVAYYMVSQGLVGGEDTVEDEDELVAAWAALTRSLDEMLLVQTCSGEVSHEETRTMSCGLAGCTSSGHCRP